MKIYLAFFQTFNPESSSASYGFWSDTLRSALLEAGHTIFECPGLDWASAMALNDAADLQSWRTRAWTDCLKHVKDLQASTGIDLFLGYFFPKQIERSAILDIRRMGISTVNFFCDNVREFRKVPDIYSVFDLHWVPEWEALPFYAKKGLPHLFAPMPAYVPPDCRTPSTSETSSVTFLGSRDALRSQLFGELAGSGVSLDIHGNGWLKAQEEAGFYSSRSDFWGKVRNQPAFIRQHGMNAWLHKFRRQSSPEKLVPPESWLHGPVSRTDYLRLSRESIVTVGVNRYDSPRFRPGEIHTYSRLRDIEAPMLGACYLTEFTPGLDHLYEIGNEVVTYRNSTELAEQIQRLKKDPLLRSNLRHSAQKHALAEHSIAHTLSRIGKKLGIGP